MLIIVGKVVATALGEDGLVFFFYHISEVVAAFKLKCFMNSGL